MATKAPSGKMRLALSRTITRMKLSFPIAKKISQTFTTLAPADHEARESLAAMWVRKLETCETEADVKKMLDEMGL